MATSFGGYMGRMLDVDLTTSTIGEYPITDTDRERYLGGKALAAKILWDILEPGIDPLSPDNPLVLTTGPLTGSGAPASSRFNLSTKNVLSGGIASSNSGGTFGLHLKRAGYDGIVIRGRAPKPSSLVITDEGVHIEDARHLWGLTTGEAVADIPKKTGHLVIGPAGERLVRYACIMSGDRALGRCGVGAVMGSKNLKLVTASGAKRMRYADKRGFLAAVKGWTKTLEGHPITGKQLPSYGTAGLVNAANATWTLPTHNFKYGHWEHADDVSGETMAETILIKNYGCVTCPIRCARMVKYEGKPVKGPEFETLGMFGPAIENRDLAKIAELNVLCDELGLDTITCGSTIACAMELAEQGRLEGLPVSFGKTEGLSELVEDIAYRRGLGDELAEGSLRLATKYGEPGLSMTSKALEFAAYEPRSAVGHGLGYAVSNRGGCHINGGYLIFFEALGPISIDPLTPLAKPALCVFQQNTMEAVSSGGTCIFTTYAVIPDTPSFLYNPHGISARIFNEVLKLTRFALGAQGKLKPSMLPFHLPLIPHTKAISTLTGMTMHLGNFSAAGERGYTLERLINLREGLTTRDDSLPPRLTDVPQRPGTPDSKVPLDVMLPEYYKVRDWDRDGVPSEALLDKLDMGFLAAEVAAIRRNERPYTARRDAMLGAEDKVLSELLSVHHESIADSEASREELSAAFAKTKGIDWALKVRRAAYEIDPAKCHACGVCPPQCPVGAIVWEKGSVATIDRKICIRCGTCKRVCPPWFNAVVALDMPKAAQRAKFLYRVDPDKCAKCGICAKKCPVGCIDWTKKALAVIDEDLCVRCGHCKTVCPDKFDAIERIRI